MKGSPSLSSLLSSESELGETKGTLSRNCFQGEASLRPLDLLGCQVIMLWRKIKKWGRRHGGGGVLTI